MFSEHALNKLADRDAYQIGVKEMEKIIECLESIMYTKNREVLWLMDTS